MKLLFICGSLEAGRDGVGDYTRRLAGELIRQGHDAVIIALNDQHISAIEQTNQESEATKIAVLRLPESLKNKERYELAEKYIKDCNPDWLSLQYVPHSFNKKGLAWCVLPFCKMAKKQKFSTTIHEPFVRVDDSKNPLQIIIALLQRWILKKILKESNFVMTSITRYKILLEKYNNNIIINRIPPNILPVSIDNQIIKHKKEEYCKKWQSSKLIVVFGERNIDNLIDAVKDINKQNTQKTGIIIIGRIQCKKHKNEDFVYYTGLLTEYDVSFHLQLADLFVLPERVYKDNRGGVSFKSGSLAAALATPLPVMTSKADMTETPPLLHSENIWFTNFNDKKKLENDIVSLLNDNELLDKIKIGGYKVYKDYLNWNIITSQYIKLFNDK